MRKIDEIILFIDYVIEVEMRYKVNYWYLKFIF